MLITFPAFNCVSQFRFQNSLVDWVGKQFTLTQKGASVFPVLRVWIFSPKKWRSSMSFYRYGYCMHWSLLETFKSQAKLLELCLNHWPDLCLPVQRANRASVMHHDFERVSQVTWQGIQVSTQFNYYKAVDTFIRIGETHCSGQLGIPL